MGLFSKKYTKEEISEMTKYRPEENTRIEYSLGTSDLDELLQYHAPKHESMLKQIIENQQRILTELDELRRIYQTPEHAAAPSYSENVR